MGSITRNTTVKEALESSKEAVSLFREHGVDPTAECGLECHVITLGRAVTRCGLDHVDDLIAKLNQAQGKNGR